MSKSKESVMKSLRNKKSVADHIQKIADKENRSFTNMVETILIDHIRITNEINNASDDRVVVTVEGDNDEPLECATCGHLCHPFKGRFSCFYDNCSSKVTHKNKDQSN